MWGLSEPSTRACHLCLVQCGGSKLCPPHPHLPSLFPCPSFDYRYLYALHYDIKKGRWSKEEERKLIELTEKYGVGEDLTAMAAWGFLVPGISVFIVPEYITPSCIYDFSKGIFLPNTAYANHELNMYFLGPGRNRLGAVPHLNIS